MSATPKTVRQITETEKQQFADLIAEVGYHQVLTQLVRRLGFEFGTPAAALADKVTPLLIQTRQLLGGM